MSLISDALGMSASYDATLSGGPQQLTDAHTREQVKAIAENAAGLHPADAQHQRGAPGRAVTLQSRDQQSASESGSDPRRKPHRSADRARQPEAFRPIH